MADYTVSIEEATNTVSVTDVINSVSVSETDGNSVTVVAATFVNDAGSSSNLFIPTGHLLMLLVQMVIFTLMFLTEVVWP